MRIPISVAYRADKAVVDGVAKDRTDYFLLTEKVFNMMILGEVEELKKMEANLKKASEAMSEMASAISKGTAFLESGGDPNELLAAARAKTAPPPPGPSSNGVPDFELDDLVRRGVKDFLATGWDKDESAEAEWVRVWQKEIEQHMKVNDFLALVREKAPKKAMPQPSVQYQVTLPKPVDKVKRFSMRTVEYLFDQRDGGPNGRYFIPEMRSFVHATLFNGNDKGMDEGEALEMLKKELTIRVEKEHTNRAKPIERSIEWLSKTEGMMTAEFYNAIDHHNSKLDGVEDASNLKSGDLR
ncbi:MAG: hypothetical protein M0R06_07520 [Sphaerochaeta sp.]|jgi:hypothetical protein|nr:hypothetical protein [Sphaerochaeta sp.]